MPASDEPTKHLSHAKRALLQRWKRGELAIGTSTIPRRNPQGPIPLSFSQQRLWFIDQLVPGNPVYNITSTIRFTGPLNVAAFAKSLNEIVRRHDILRTTFPTRDGIATQEIAPSLILPLPVIDVSTLPDQEREAAALQLAINAAQQPFDLSLGPLLLTRLIRLADQQHIFLLIMHHIISDGWSQSIFLRELKTLYEAYLNEKLSPLPTLPLQYADFAVWQREWLQGGVLASQLSYWKEQLTDAAPVLQLPIDQPRPTVQTFRGKTRVFELSAPLSQALKDLSQQAGCTLYMTLLAAFKLLLYRYSGQEDIIVGIPIANRQRVETEGLIGFFANTQAVRTRFTGPCSFLDLLGRVRENLLGAYSHQDLPFEYLVEELHLERDTSRNPLFQVMLNFGNAPNSDPHWPGLHAEFSAISGGTAMFDLWLTLWEWQEQLRGSLEFNTDIFEHTTIDRFIQHFQTLLASIVAHPDQSIADLPLLTTTEQQQILLEWNATQAAYPLESCLHQHLEERVKLAPDALAVIFAEQQLTYAALNQQANQLAHHLRTLGVGPDIPVGIAMERSVEMIIALLSILKAGGAYVPLEPSYPAERLAFLLTDTGISVVLTQQRFAGQFPEQGMHILCLDTNRETWTHEDITNPICHTQPDNLAYIIYTSGSTGQPKGVMNTHQSICNRLLWMQEAYNLTATDRVLQKTPFSFDVSVWEFFWPLLAGACLVVAQPEGHRDSAYLAALIGEAGITTLHFVPSMLHVFLEESTLHTCTSLKRVICSGEALPLEEVQRFLQLLDAQLYNLYGPTEAAVDVTSWPCREQYNSAVVPIGRPIANTQIYLLDPRFNPVPIGVTGELYIGGVAPARGYLRRPGLTAEKFLPDPFSSQLGSRLYRTGDLARYLPDGSIEFQGRIDHQIKLRGFRIETGEIESTLRQHPEVQEAVVLLREDIPAHPQLVAYVVLPEQGEIAQNSTQQVAHWQEVFEQMYHDAAPAHDALLNLAGWISSYTGQPIPTDEMREWVERAVDRLLALQPQHILEIGCGSGLLLLRLAPHCQSYTGTDFSHVALSTLEQQLQTSNLSHVQLLERRADNFTGLQTGSYDLVILNSVVQYFPGAEYLLSVIEGALKLLTPGGTLFIGDVRHLGLLELFHTSVELHWAKENLSLEQLQQRIRQRIQQEAELLIDPAFFHTLPERFPSLASVQILLKRGLFTNELTRFRYDVLLTTTEEQASNILPAGIHLDWREQPLDHTQIRQLLQAQTPPLLTLTHIPNARLTSEASAYELLANKHEQLHTVADLHRAIEQRPPIQGIEPEELWEACNDLPYTVSLHWSGAERDGSFQAVFQHQSLVGTITAAPQPTAETISPVLTNRPLHNQLVHQRITMLREYLKVRLPEYMIPSIIEPLTSIPLTANGKIDRKALPAIAQTRTTAQAAHVAPRTPVEAALVAIWQQVLGLDRIGIHDNFFELGGDSIRSIQIVSRANANGLLLTPRLLFQHQTIAELATVTETIRAAANNAQPLTTQEQLPQADRSLVSFDLDQLRLLTGNTEKIEDVYPLTPMQRNMIFQHLHSDNKELYWICWATTIRKANINMAAVEQAWQRLVDQHAIGRTMFVWEGLDEPLQIVFKQAKMVVEQYDWRDLPPSQQAKQAEEYIQGLRSRGNRFSQVPHFHLAFAHISDEDYYMFRCFNYMLQDGWSSTLLNRDFAAFYEALCRGQDIQVEPPRRYRDYFVWLQQQDFTGAETFWRKKLAGMTTATALANQSLPGHPQAGEAYVKERLPLSVATTTALQAMGRRQQLTLATILTGAWALIVNHYSRSEAITFGYLCSGRPSTLAGSEYMVGFFNNILPFHLHISESRPLLPWLQELQAQLAELREYEQTPIQHIKTWLGVPASARLFESYLVFENFPRYNYETIGGKARLDFGIQHSDSRQTFVPTEYPLRVEFWPFQQLVIMMSGYKSYFKAETLTRLLQQMQTILEGMLANPSQNVGALMRLLAE